jgi:hypothetical protein
MSLKNLSDRLGQNLDLLHESTVAKCDDLRRRKQTLHEKLAAVEWEMRTEKEVVRLIDGLRRCHLLTTLLGHNGSTWLFCRSYEVSDKDQKLLTIDCLIIPEIVQSGTVERRIPQEDGHARLVRETGTPDEVIEGAIGLSPANVSRGSAEEILTEPCDRCGRLALVAVELEVDGMEGDERLHLRRFCPHCKLITDIAHVYSGRVCPLRLLVAKKDVD